MRALDPAFLTLPLAHRGLHDRSAGIVENSVGAFRAAIAAGYGIELDVQLSRDDVAMVFHDDTLDRLTAARGEVRLRTSAELGTLHLIGSEETIPTLAQVLDEVGGRVPLLIEIKDQSGALSTGGIGPLEAAVAAALSRYSGPVAVMSFNPNSMRALRGLNADLCLGLTTCDFAAADWPEAAEADRHAAARMEALEDTGAAFISHDRQDLDSPQVAKVRARGLPVLCWTVRSPAQEAEARRFANNITFEGYRPAMGPA